MTLAAAIAILATIIALALWFALMQVAGKNAELRRQIRKFDHDGDGKIGGSRAHREHGA